MTTSDRQTRITACLEEAFSPTQLTLKDCSAAHAGHEGAAGGGHYQLAIQAEDLSSTELVASHKKIYKALGSLMETDIHALSIEIL